VQWWLVLRRRARRVPILRTIGARLIGAPVALLLSWNSLWEALFVGVYVRPVQGLFVAAVWRRRRGVNAPPSEVKLHRYHYRSFRHILIIVGIIRG